MNPFDLRKAITKGNISEKIYWESMNTIVESIETKEDIKMLFPDKETAKMFFDAVIKRIKEMPVDLP